MTEPAPALRDDLVGRIYRRLNCGFGNATSTDCIKAVLYAAEIEAGGIREEERAAGRDEALREVVAFVREQNEYVTDRRVYVALTRAANAIEAAFPTTGDGL